MSIKVIALAVQEATLLRLQGIVDQSFSLNWSDFPNLKSTVKLHLRGISSFSDRGREAWIRFVSSTPTHFSLEILACPTFLWKMRRSDPLLFGRGILRSVVVDFLCPYCKHQTEFVMMVVESDPFCLTGDAKAQLCTQCQREMVLADTSIKKAPKPPISPPNSAVSTNRVKKNTSANNPLLVESKPDPTEQMINALRTLFIESYHPLVLVDRNWKILFANYRFEQMAGCDPKEFPHTSLDELFELEWHQQRMVFRDAATISCPIHRWEHVSVKGHAQQFFVELKWLKDGDLALIQFVEHSPPEISDDKSDSKATERVGAETLEDISQHLADVVESEGINNRAQAEYLRALIEAMPTGVVEIDEQGHFAFVNSTAAELLESSQNDLIGKSLFEFAVDDPSRESLRTFVVNSFATQNEPSPLAIRMRGRQGTIAVDFIWDYRFGPQGEILGLIGVLTKQQLGRRDRMSQRHISGVLAALDSKPLRDRKILVIEDADSRKVINQLLEEKTGCTVTSLANIEAALATCTQDHYDMIFVDTGLSNAIGFDVIKEIRKLQGYSSQTPIIALIKTASREALQRCLNAGADDYLEKPVSTLGIQAILQRWLHLGDTFLFSA